MLCDVHWINPWVQLNDIPWNPDQLTTLHIVNYNIGYWTYPKLCLANLEFPHLSKRFAKQCCDTVIFYWTGSSKLLDSIFAWLQNASYSVIFSQLYEDINGATTPILNIEKLNQKYKVQWKNLNIKKIYYWSIMVRATDSQISFDSSSHQKEDRRAHRDPAKEQILYLYLPL